MSITEIFPNPTVKQVIFQIRFPNLFFLENKIGDFQIKIMERFPDSGLLFRRQVIFADLGPEAKLEDIPREAGRKIWQFKSKKNVELNVLQDSLDINSKYHKTYKLGDGAKFRDIIEFVVQRFFEVTSIPIIERIGLRYIDECPILSNDNNTFTSYYNSKFPLDKFNLANAKEMDFKAVVKKGDYYLHYAESLQKQKNDADNYSLRLDFDGFAENIKSEDYLTVLDSLHEIISDEYEKTIKAPVYEYMRQKKED